MPKKITQEEATKIIDTREPLGTFWLTDKIKGKAVYVGIDNSTGDAWTEDFKSKGSCLRWLGE
jgi:NAD(P)H-flavin reductase